MTVLYLGYNLFVMCPTTFKNGIHQNLYDDLVNLNYVKKEKLMQKELSNL